jgi:arylsulfatase A-like enzyme
MAQGAPVDGKDLTPDGRMIRSRRYKYCLYSEGKQRESLVDTQNDPGEMVNQAENPEFGDVLRQHRSYLKEFANTYNDSVALKMLEFVE